MRWYGNGMPPYKHSALFLCKCMTDGGGGGMMSLAVYVKAKTRMTYDYTNTELALYATTEVDISVEQTQN